MRRWMSTFKHTAQAMTKECLPHHLHGIHGGQCLFVFQTYYYTVERVFIRPVGRPFSTIYGLGLCWGGGQMS